MQSSEAILERFRLGYGKDIDLTLRPAYRDLLKKLGNPHHKLPPVFHVAGTNGKGSTCAFLRAFLEAAGFRVHVYTSPHLVQFHERIRIAGKLISEDELSALLVECENFAEPRGVSYFEASTAAALAAFARHPADFTILETGLGGRLDATNVVDHPLATIITRLSYDHRDYLGDTLEKIAREKAGIMRKGVPCFTAHQPDARAAHALRDAAEKVHAPLFAGGAAWHVRGKKNSFHFDDTARKYDLPHPALLGEHQIQNAGLALAALSVLPQPLLLDAIKNGLKNVQWPARLQRLEQGALAKFLPAGSELWLDGGHNDSAGEVLAAQAQTWRDGDLGKAKPLVVVVGMLATKRPLEFLSPLSPFMSGITTVAIPKEPLSFSAEDLAATLRAAKLPNISASENVANAVNKIARTLSQPSRILICGSLYLAGHVLQLNDAS